MIYHYFILKKNYIIWYAKLVIIVMVMGRVNYGKQIVVKEQNNAWANH